ncbi:MAG TPA: hypothetical protein DDZ66_13860, partial [Firmicutes bacterium]|nr:hypothetical protein [Bacillota bacterium]
RYFDAVRIGAVLYIAVLITLLVLIVRSKRFFQWIVRKKGESRPVVWFEEFRSTIHFILGQRRGHFLACYAVAFSYYVVYYAGSFMLLTGFGVYSPWLRYAIAVLFGVA